MFFNILYKLVPPNYLDLETEQYDPCEFIGIFINSFVIVSFDRFLKFSGKKKSP